MQDYLETGQPIFSLGFSEPGAGSDNQAMTCVTRKQEDGTYLLNGQKTWVTQGEVFPNVLVIAKDEDPARENKSMSMWIVPKDAPGLSTAPLHKIGQKVAAFCEMYFDGVVLTEDMRIGKPGEGFLNLMRNFETERCLIVAQCIGVAQAAMDDAAAYVSERTTFGKPIANYQLIQLKLTEMEIALQNSRNMLYKCLWKMDNGQSVRIDSALLKYYAGKACTMVASEALQDLRRPRLHRRDARRAHVGRPARHADCGRHRRDHGLHRRAPALQEVRAAVALCSSQPLGSAFERKPPVVRQSMPGNRQGTAQTAWEGRGSRRAREERYAK